MTLEQIKEARLLSKHVRWQPADTFIGKVLEWSANENGELYARCEVVSKPKYFNAPIDQLSTNLAGTPHLRMEKSK